MRKSSIELIRIIAITLIVINHVTMTLEALGVSTFIDAYSSELYALRLLIPKYLP